VQALPWCYIAGGSTPRELLQIELNLVCFPSGNASAKEVFVVCPNRRIKKQSYRDDRPLHGVGTCDSRPGRWAERLVQLSVYRLDDPFQPAEHRERFGGIYTAPFQRLG
jgi:hypothetical protein